MSQVVVTELIVDARGAEQGTALYTRAMNAAQAAIDRVIDREEKMIVAQQKATAAMTGGAASVGAVAKQWERLRAVADPAVAATQKIEAATLRADAAVRRGIATQEEAARVIDLVRQKNEQVLRSAAAANDNIRLTTNQVGNLSYQLNDVATMLAMGASPFQILASQAGQVIQVLQDGPGGVRGSLKAMGAQMVGLAASIGPVGLALGGATAAILAFGYAFRDSFPDMEETLERHGDLLGRIGDQYGTLKDRIQAAGQAAGIGLNVEAGALARDLQALIEREMRAVDIDFTSYLGQAIFGGLNIANAPTRGQFAVIAEMVDEFRAGLKDGSADVDAFRQSLADLYARAGDDAEMRKAIEAAFRYTDGLADLERRAEQTRVALEGMAGTLPGIGADIERFGGVLDYFERINPEGMDELREGLKRQREEMERTNEEAGEYGRTLADQQDDIAASVQALQTQVDMFGESAGAIAAARFETEQLAATRRAAAEAGEIVTPEQEQAIRDAAGEIGTLTDELRKLNEERRQSEKLASFDEDISFRMEQLGRTDIEQRVASQLRSIGLEYGSAQAQMREGQLRYLETVEATKSEMLDMGEVGRGVFTSLIDAIGSGESAVDSLIGVFANLGKQLASLGAQKLFDGLFGTGQNATASSIGNLAGAIGQIAQRPAASPFSAPLYSSGSTLGQTYAAPVIAVERRTLSALSDASSSFTAAAKAIRTIESGSAAGNYRALGPITRTGDRAYGAYQMMGANIPEWSKAALGRVVSNVEFLSSPKLQDAIFEHRFGGYMAKYGPEGASRAWFAGEGGMRNWNAQDVVGTSVGGYGSKFGQLYSQYGGNIASSANDSQFLRQQTRAVSEGVIDANRRLASGVDLWVGMRSTTAGPIMSPQAQAALAGGWSGFGPMPGASGGGGIGGFFRSPFGQGTMNALGAFSAGVSGGPIGGALTGGLGAIGMGLGPIGIIAGVGGGILGGLFGGRKEREQKHRRQQQAWEQMLPQWREFQEVVATGTGPSSGLADTFKDMTAQFETFMEVGADAWKYGRENSTELHHQVGQDLYDFKERTRAAFRDTWDSILDSLEAGRGLTTPFVEARDAIVAVGDQLKTFVSDTSEAFYGDPERIEQAQEAARQQALMMLEPAEALSQIQSDVERFQGAAAALRIVLVDLGMTTEEAASAVDERLVAAVSRLGETIEQDLRDQIAELDGKGYLADFRALIEGNARQMADIAASGLNVDTSLVETLFRKQAQALVDGAELAGSAFQELITLSPQLAGVVTAFGASGQAAVDKARADLDRAMAAHTEEVNERIAKLREEASEIERTVSQLESFVETISQLRQDLLVNDDLSPLSNRARMEEARDQFRELADRLKSEDQAIREAAMAELPGASQEYLDESRQFYASSEAYYEAFDEVQRVLAETELTAKSQLSEAQRQLLALERSIAAEEAGLLKLQEQIDALLKIDESVLSIGEAMGNLAGAIEAMAAARAVGGGGGGGSGVVYPSDAPANPGSEREVAYLNSNPDVRAAIEAGNWFGAVPGDVESAVRGHYALHGRNEGRNYAMGGLVLGPGSGTSDSIAAWLSNGEHITRAASVNAHTMPVLDHINRLGRLPEIRMPEMPRFAGNDNSALIEEVRQLRREAQENAKALGDIMTRISKDEREDARARSEIELRRRASNVRLADQKAKLLGSRAA